MPVEVLLAIEGDTEIEMVEKWYDICEEYCNHYLVQPAVALACAGVTMREQEEDRKLFVVGWYSEHEDGGRKRGYLRLVAADSTEEIFLYAEAEGHDDFRVDRVQRDESCPILHEGFHLRPVKREDSQNC